MAGFVECFHVAVAFPVIFEAIHTFFVENSSVVVSQQSYPKFFCGRKNSGKVAFYETF